MGMNGEQQRERHTAVTKLAGDMDTFAAEVETLLENFSRELQSGIVTLHQTDLALQSQIDGAAKIAIAHTVEATSVLRRGFWSRMNWIFTGR